MEETADEADHGGRQGRREMMQWKKTRTSIAVGLLMLAPLTTVVAKGREKLDPNVPEAVQQLYSFVGYWPGTARIEQTGAPALDLIGHQECNVVARGWAIQCVGHFVNDAFELNESFQGAYDAASGKIYWQVMYSTGPQAFTVTGNFNDAGTELNLSRSADTPVGEFVEIGTWRFLSPMHRVLEINGSLGGEPTHRITADLWLRAPKKKH
jgi:hypothetical protein